MDPLSLALASLIQAAPPWMQMQARAQAGAQARLQTITLSGATIEIPAMDPSLERVLHLSHETLCAPDSLAPLIPGELHYRGRIIRFDLVEGNPEARIALGPGGDSAERAELLFPERGTALGSGCDTQRIDAFFTAENTEALRFSPFIEVREDQLRDRFTDLPLLLAYSVLPGQNGERTIRYTAYFSDEDSARSIKHSNAQLARYGRRLDIEWVYEVRLRADGGVIESHFQGGVVGGAGHARHAFRGGYAEASTHPLLQDIATHHVFSDKLRGKTPTYQLAAQQEIPPPEAREWMLVREPWMMAVSDAELAREGKLGLPAQDYLYTLIEGRLTRGSLRARMELIGGQAVESGGGKGTLDRLGEDLWGAQSFTAIPLQDIDDANLHGRFQFRRTSAKSPRFSLSSLRFLRLKRNGRRMEWEDRSSRFHCLLQDLNTRCIF